MCQFWAFGYFGTMKKVIGALLLLTVVGCEKEKEEDQVQPELPIHRYLYADFNQCDTGAVDVYLARATQPRSLYRWKHVDGTTYTLTGITGQYQAKVYRNDSLFFYSDAAGDADVSMRVDDIQAWNVHVSPGQNGNVVDQRVLNW